METNKEYRLSYTLKAQSIISKMSLEEKVYLMSGRVSTEQLLEDFFTPNRLKHYNWYPYPAGGNERLGVPELKFCDGPRGVVCGQSTCFPVAMGRGASFDTDLEERIGEAIGKEIRAHDGNFYGGVCINLPYNPGWGRSQEVYGEESFHLGQMGSALIRGVQKHNVIACAKHFAFNSMENARFKVNVEADARTEKEVFLPHFKDCVDVGAASIMSSYNKYMGKQCGHSNHLLSEVLKKEWDFDGFVVSDFVWGVKDTVEAANGGLDVEMCNTMFYGDKLVQAVQDGLVKESAVDEAALRIVRTLLAFTEAEDPQKYSKEQIACSEHISLAREAAEKSMTLIQNKNNVLPFSKSKVKKLALIGKLADVKNIGDHGSSQVFPPYVVTPLQGISKAVSDCEVEFYQGDDTDHAADLARWADAVVIVAGYNHDDEGEFVADTDDAQSVGGDRKNTLGLSQDDINLIKKVGSANRNTAVVLIGGNMIMIEEWKDYVSAILMAFYPGMEGGTAIAETLFGDINPGGKLPFVIPKRESDLPEVDWDAEQITYGYYHGYTKLEKEGIEPCVPYGFGLSYTTFDMSGPSVSVNEDSVSVSCLVRNTGSVKGDQVVQFYTGFGNSVVDRPLKLLRGFKRISLNPGAEKIVTISCPIEKLKWYNPGKGRWELEHMPYEAYIGTSSDNKDLMEISFKL
jgi:beta-glucosidase